jgi:hypothetical protein
VSHLVVFVFTGKGPGGTTVVDILCEAPRGPRGRESHKLRVCVSLPFNKKKKKKMVVVWFEAV